MAEWDAELEITPDLVRSLIEAQHPDLAGIEPEPWGEGFDNAAFRVGEWLFRFPRRTFGGEAMAVEVEWLPRLAAELPFPIPAPERSGAPEGGYPWPWAGYRLIAGGPRIARVSPPTNAGRSPSHSRISCARCMGSRSPRRRRAIASVATSTPAALRG